MKRIIVRLLLLCICTSIFGGCTSTLNIDAGKTYNYEDVEDVLIRFHVIANSDTEEDQNLKLKVRDKVIEYMYPYLKESSSLEESRNIIISKEVEVEGLALKVIKENGYGYSVKTELSRENFPEKAYGNIILPQGEYEAFRVIIGNGEGKNWWCVMFPPLCFIDVTKGQVQEQESENQLDEQIEQSKETEKIEMSKKEDAEDEAPKVKFKIVEIFKNIFD
ncbi:stage II sporulation protein R [Clostridium vincentii]|uniref:Stage II sporulation protein R n=1 Tax=Clostridium vincentii TaxID=52704 RepID=A0A2T0BGZ0_9CLOT|nr:stage II sporulation protein R [Clostridium vincentii]PRR83171.1 Stage II sporulation protein R [Clostridium vincentii]